MKNKCMLVVILLILSGTAFAKIVLPPIFSDNMVLQQQTNAPIWGEAQPMKTVKVTMRPRHSLSRWHFPSLHRWESVRCLSSL